MKLGMFLNLLAIIFPFYFMNITNYAFGLLPDRVVNTTVKSKWLSLTFLIPFEVQENDWQNCRKYSEFYCLFSYQTKKLNPNKAVEVVLHLNSFEFLSNAQLSLDIYSQRVSEIAFRPIYRGINYFMGANGCCVEQNFNYYTFGFNELLLKHNEYVKKLTDYNDGKKVLNNIGAFYFRDCDANIITKVGFGKGKLLRSNHHVSLNFQKRGAPYRLRIGRHHWTPPIPYENPGDFLTFRWFKLNIMCQDQPWICKEPTNNLTL